MRAWRGQWVHGSRGAARAVVQSMLRAAGRTSGNHVGDARISYKQPEVYTRGRWWSEHNFTSAQRWLFGTTFVLAGASYSVLPDKWENTTTRQMLKHFAAEEERRGHARNGAAPASLADAVRAHAPLVSALATAASVGAASLLLGMPALGTLCCVYSSSLLAHSVWAVAVEKGEARDDVRAELHTLYDDVAGALAALDKLDTEGAEGAEGAEAAAEVLRARVWAAWARFGELHILGAPHRAPDTLAAALNHSDSVAAAVLAGVGVTSALRHAQYAPRVVLTNGALGLFLGFMVGASVHGFSKRLPGYLGSEPSVFAPAAWACAQPLALGGGAVACFAPAAAWGVAVRGAAAGGFVGVAVLLGAGLAALTLRQSSVTGERVGYTRTTFHALPWASA